MSNYAIRVEGLGKRYCIGERQQYKALRDVLTGALTAPARAAGRLLRGQAREARPDNHIWALKDVSFEVAHGEVLGIIGRNGAGKSTLLKILSRITEPTEGEVRLRGRVGSLLEVGTGFHPELTGRENIYLNGAVLGMHRAEIERKFDEIVAFAEVERFIDTPVKHYSSGMAVRLGFAVAAHLEPEILLVDEVLAVGDASFQRKCLGKMDQVAGEGRTVLFVSHNMNAVCSLCQQAIVLEMGRVWSAGRAPEQVARYVSASQELLIRETAEDGRSRSPIASVRSVRTLDECGRERHSFEILERFRIEMTIAQSKLDRPIRLVVRIRSAADNSVVLATTDWDLGKPIQQMEAGEYRAECLIPENLLNTGAYVISVGIDEPRGPVHFLTDDVATFVIVNTSSFGMGVFGERDGSLSPYRVWRFAPPQSDAGKPGR